MYVNIYVYIYICVCVTVCSNTNLVAMSAELDAVGSALFNNQAYTYPSI